MRHRRLTYRPLAAAALLLAGCAGAVNQPTVPTTGAAPAAGPVAVAAAAGTERRRPPFEMTPEQVERLQAMLRQNARPGTDAALKDLGESVDGDLGKLSPEQREQARKLMAATVTSTRFWGMGGDGTFAGEGTRTALGGDRYMYRVPRDKVLVVTMAENPHMVSVNGFQLAAQPNSFTLDVSSSSSSNNNCNSYYYWWYWYYGSCGYGGYWGWWYWYYYGWGGYNNNSNSNSSKASARSEEHIYKVSYMFGDDEPVVFGKVALNGWRLSGFTVPDSYVNGTGIGMAK